jgi:hypothetical protein
MGLIPGHPAHSVAIISNELPQLFHLYGWRVIPWYTSQKVVHLNLLVWKTFLKLYSTNNVEADSGSNASICIWKVPGLNQGQDTVLTRFSSDPPGKCQDSTLN